MGCQQSKVKDNKSPTGTTPVPYLTQGRGVVIPAEESSIATAPVINAPVRRSPSQPLLAITVAAKKSCSPERPDCLAASTTTTTNNNNNNNNNNSTTTAVRFDMMEQTCCRPEDYQGGFDNTITLRRPSPSPAPAEDEVVIPQVVIEQQPQQPLVPLLPSQASSSSSSRQPSQRLCVISREESRQPNEPQPREPSRPSAKSSVTREPSAQPVPRDEVSLLQQTSLVRDNSSQEPHHHQQQEEERRGETETTTTTTTTTVTVPEDSVVVAKSDLMQLALAVAAAEMKEARRRMRAEKRRATLASHHANNNSNSNNSSTRVSGNSAIIEDVLEGSVRSRKSVAFTREVLEATLPECCQPQKKKALRRSVGRRDNNHAVEAIPSEPVADSEEDMWCDISFQDEDENNNENNITNSAIMTDPTTEVFPRLSGLLERALRVSAERGTTTAEGEGEGEGVSASQPLQQQQTNNNTAARCKKAAKGGKKKNKGDDFVYCANSDTLNIFGKKSTNRRRKAPTENDENNNNSGIIQHNNNNKRRNRRPHSHAGKALHLHANISEEKYQEMANAFARLLTDIQTFDAQMAS